MYFVPAIFSTQNGIQVYSNEIKLQKYVLLPNFRLYHDFYPPPHIFFYKTYHMDRSICTIIYTMSRLLWCDNACTTDSTDYEGKFNRDGQQFT